MAGSVTVEVSNGLKRLPRVLREKLQAAVTRNTLEVERSARLNTDRVASGAMRAGWYSVTPDDSTYDGAKGEAERLQPGVETLEAVATDEEMTGIVANAIAYTVNHEVGTVYIAADPMLEPALEAQRDRFNESVGRAVDEAARKVAP